MKIHVIITMIAFGCISYSSHLVCKKELNYAHLLGLGAVAFFVSSQVLEKIVHLLVLHPQKRWNHFAHAGSILFLYVLYGIAMAAIFENGSPCLL